MRGHEKKLYEPESFDCLECGSSFKHRKAFTNHIKRHGVLNQEEVQVPIERDYACAKCDLKFPSLQTLQNHYSTHKLKCQDCDLSFEDHKSLTKHVKDSHTPEDIFLCDICGKTFSRAYNLQRHLDRRHSEKLSDDDDDPIDEDEREFKMRKIDTPDFIITQKDRQFVKKFELYADRYTVTFTPQKDLTTFPEIMRYLHDSLDTILDKMLDGVDPSDQVQIILESESLDIPISLKFMPRRNVDSDLVFTHMESNLQSAKDFSIDESLEIAVKIVKGIEGSGHWKLQDLDVKKFLHSKRSIIELKNRDEICLARCIVTWKAYLDEDPEYENLRKGRLIQWKRATDLHRLAGVPTNRPSTLEDLKEFQRVLPDYQLILVSRAHENAVIYEGPASDDKIHIYYSKKHYSIITKMPG